MLSNSDPRNGNYQDTFFDDLFDGYHHRESSGTAYDQLQWYPPREY